MRFTSVPDLARKIRRYLARYNEPIRWTYSKPAHRNQQRGRTALESHLHAKAPKTVNSVLTVLNVLLKMAVEWNVIDRHPCMIRLLPISRKKLKGKLVAGAGFEPFQVIFR